MKKKEIKEIDYLYCRLTASDGEKLDDIIHNVQDLSDTMRIKKTHVIAALIKIGHKLPPDQIYKYIT